MLSFRNKNVHTLASRFSFITARVSDADMPDIDYCPLQYCNASFCESILSLI